MDNLDHWTSIVPEHGSESVFIDGVEPYDGKRHVVYLWPGDEIAKYTGVIVERWNHKLYGRGKRDYLKGFTEAERKKIGQLHTKAYGWVLRSGHPGHIQMSVATYHLLVRAANFFATI